jgi:hypothetical protein
MSLCVRYFYSESESEGQRGEERQGGEAEEEDTLSFIQRETAFADLPLNRILQVFQQVGHTNIT